MEKVGGRTRKVPSTLCLLLLYLRGGQRTVERLQEAEASRPRNSTHSRISKTAESVFSCLCQLLGKPCPALHVERKRALVGLYPKGFAFVYLVDVVVLECPLNIPR